MPSIWRKTGGSWSKIKTVYYKTGGTWQSVRRVWRKAGGVWSLVFLQSVTPSIQTRVAISKANTATQTVRLTGTLYHWLNATSVTYQFARSTNAVNYSNITGASGTSTNPSSGGNNTNDQYTLAQADVIANTTNYYIYISRASNSTFGTEQTSTSDSITVEAPRDLILSSSKTSSKITISWNNDTYSGRYEYQYKATSNATWNTAVFISPGTTTTSFQITGLSASTSYDFRVRGWTGTSNSYGYYGNWASVTVSTNAIQAPNPPKNLTASSVSKDSFFLNWDAPDTDDTHDAPTSYDYGVSTSNSTAPSTQISGTSGSSLNPSNGEYRNEAVADTNRSELIDELSASTDYYGWVRAKNSGGSSNWATSAKITTLALKPPNSVTNLTHSSADRTQTSLKFTWTAPSTDSTHDSATKYIYHTSTTNSEPTEANYNGYIDGGTNTSVTVSSLSAGTLYYFWIKAGNADGYSASATSSGTTLAASNPPGSPTSVTLGNASQSGLGFDWAAPSSGGTPTSYLIALHTTTTEPTQTSTTTYVNRYFDVGLVTTYRFVGLSAGTTYYAWVKAKNADGDSGAGVRRNTSTAVEPTVSLPSWSAASNFQRTTNTIKWGWNNGTVSPTTGTYTTMTPAGFFWEFYTSATTTTINSSGYKSYTTTNDTRTTVNSAYYRYLLWSAGSSPDITYSSSSRFVRIQYEAYDYDSKTWTSAWSGRI